MNNNSRLIVTVLVLSVMFLTACASSVSAQKGPISQSDFRKKLTEYAAWLDSNNPQTGNLETRIREMSTDEFEVLYDSFADPDAFFVLIEQIMTPVVLDPATNFFAPQNAQLMPDLFTPDYPSGVDYDNWTATLPGLGLLLDTDGDGSLVNERCTSNGEAQMELAWSTLKAAAIVADALCGGDPTGASCVAYGVTEEAVHANEIAIHQCSSQDGFVDSAEIEAAYENSKIISGQVNDVSTQVNNVSAKITTHDTEIKNLLTSQNTELKNLLATHDTEIKNALATHDTDIKDLLTIHDSEIQNLLVTHDTAIKNLLATHDADIKSILATHDADIKNILAAHDAVIRNLIATHDTEVKTALQEHHNAVIVLITANQSQSLRIDIEMALADTNDNKRISLFYLPYAHGGLLELVRQTVLDNMNANLAAGLSIGNAQSWFDRAEESFAAGDYKKAYDQYAKAYKEVVK